MVYFSGVARGVIITIVFRPITSENGKNIQ